jgi:hypothetical protein
MGAERAHQLERSDILFEFLAIMHKLLPPELANTAQAKRSTVA